MQNLSLREQFIRDMKLKNFSEFTQKAYLSHIIRYSGYYRKSPTDLGDEHIKAYLNKLVSENKSSSYLNQAYGALKYLYETTLKRDWDSFRIPRSKKAKQLPLAFSQQEIIKFFEAIRNIKHRAIFELIYCGGLRISGVLKLKATDINRKDMSIRIRLGKGKKDRYTILSRKALETLIRYYHIFRPVDLLFPGEKATSPLTTRTIQSSFKAALGKAGINKPLTVHSLRHSFATHMLESGVDIYHLQKLMGHSNVKTTSVYIHVSLHKALHIQSPHDSLYDK